MSGFALQQAVFAALTADSDIAALTNTRIFDAVPRDAAFPYLALGEGRQSDWSTKTDTGEAITFTVTAWSRATGFAEVKVLADGVRACLDRAALTVTGATLVDLAFQGAVFGRETDGLTRRATLTFRALLEF